MTSTAPNPVTGLPYSLVEVDEPKKPLTERVRGADSLQWRLWIVKYAWLLSIVTMAPGIALASFMVTRDLAFALIVTSVVVVTSGGVFWWRTRQLP